jgi:hypothetical protein
MALKCILGSLVAIIITIDVGHMKAPVPTCDGRLIDPWPRSVCRCLELLKNHSADCPVVKLVSHARITDELLQHSRMISEAREEKVNSGVVSLG